MESRDTVSSILSSSPNHAEKLKNEAFHRVTIITAVYPNLAVFDPNSGVTLLVSFTGQGIAKNILAFPGKFPSYGCPGPLTCSVPPDTLSKRLLSRYHFPNPDGSPFLRVVVRLMAAYSSSLDYGYDSGSPGVMWGYESRQCAQLSWAPTPHGFRDRCDPK